MLVSSQEKKAASQMMPYLITGHAGGKFPGRQGLEAVGIDDHMLGLIEGTHHVLAEGMVDGGLAADGRVNLGEQRGRHLNKRNASLVACRSKADNITYHTAPRAIRVVSRPWLVSSRADMIRSKVARVL